MRLRRGSSRWVLRIMVVSALLGGLVTAIQQTASAASGGIHSSGIQELDGSLDFTGNTTAYKTTTHDTAVETTAPYDWSSLFTGGTDGVITTSGATCRVGSCPGLINDVGLPYSGGLFTQGSKDTADVSGWTCTQQANPPKDELVNTYASAWSAPSTAGSVLAGDTVAFMGLERPNTKGNANAGFWLFKKSVICNPTTGKFSGSHSNGDVFLVGSFLGGGTNAVLNQYSWNCLPVTTSDPTCASTGSLTLNQTGALNCPDVTGTSDTFCQVVNQQVVNGATTNWTVKTPWNNIATGSGGIPGPGFLEIGIDLSQALATPGAPAPCFASFLADTRSSGSSTQAETKDFINGSFPTCHPSTTMKTSPSTASPATIHSGDSSLFTFYETNDGNVPLTAPAVNATVSPANVSGGCSPTSTSTGPLAPGVTRTFTCTVSAITADISVTATGTGIDTQGNTVTYCTTPPTNSTICNLNEQTLESVHVIKPGTDLTLASATASPSTIHSGSSTVLTFYDKNTGDEILASPGVSLLPDVCAPLFAGSDNGTGTITPTDTNGTFDPGETWAFSCTTTSITSTATIVGTGDAVDSLGGHVTVPLYPKEQTTVTVTVVNPNTTLEETGSAVVTYTFKESNNGDVALTKPSPGGWITFDPAHCDAAPAFVSSSDTDFDGDAKLDVNETLVFTCTHTLTPADSEGSATETNIGVGHGMDPTGADITTPTYASETDRVTVTVANG